MGLGLNAADHDPPISHVLAPKQQQDIRIVKAELNVAEREHVIHEFSKWIRINGLRDLIETVSIFMDRIYIPLFILHNGKDRDGGALPKIKNFKRLGLSKKFEVVARIRNLSEADLRIIRSLHNARICYAHRLGVVGAEDVDPATSDLVIRWNALQLEIVEPDGSVVHESAMFGRTFEFGGTIQSRVIERVKTFNLGVEIILSKQDLKEICISTLWIGQRLIRETAQAAHDAGVLNAAMEEDVNDNQVK